MRSYKKSPEDETIVSALATAGLPHREIAAAIGIRPTALRKHYREILKTAALKANASVLCTLFKMATSGNDTAATIFWAKTRLRWTETQRVENVNTAENLEVRALLGIINDELKHQPELKYKIAQRLQLAGKEAAKVQ